MSYKNKDYCSCLYEIIRMVEIGGVKFEIKMKLKDNKEIIYLFNTS